ncbi:hypothetical protein MNBD_GAMMA04-1658 [hydrothermal vent metagenome]|uniref:Pseudouridine synthase RsuA/RluA-like domain-containing protein n=1 Tax=hydrothermal vent metagenome TaxID=652676 RepID=A0A3B0VK62_9ZZZZ
MEHLYREVHRQCPSENISKQALKHYALNGAVWLSSFNAKSNKSNKPERLRRLKKRLNPNDQLDFYYHPTLLNSEPTPPTLIADFTQYSVWLKPRGMLSQGSKWADHTALYRWVEMHYQPNNQSRTCWIVHRLDRATCGLMLVAHSKKMAQTLSQLFEQKQIRKSYQANVWGEFPSTLLTFNTPVQDKPATSHVTLLKRFFSPPLSPVPTISRVQITIETGRKHQIRTHLSQAGYPIVGDRLYGGDKNLQRLSPAPDLQLTAYQLDFECPITHTPRHFCLSDEQLALHVQLHNFSTEQVLK